MKELHDFVQRTAVYRNVSKDQTETSGDDTEAPLFEQRVEREGDVSSGAEAAARRGNDNEVSCGDFWESMMH